LCVVKTPKVSPTDPSQKPIKPTVIRNTYFDDLSGARIQRAGRSSLRIDRGTTRGSTAVPATPLARSTLGPAARGGGAIPGSFDTNVSNPLMRLEDMGRITPRGF
jgi:hypothetical protein